MFLRLIIIFFGIFFLFGKSAWAGACDTTISSATTSQLSCADDDSLTVDSGGSITFGSPDFGSNRKTFKEYQQNATPVYIDITHKNDEITRFYGVITKMSEDHPLGAMTRKYSVTLQIAYIIELNSDGTMLSDGRIALGGKITNEPEYIL